MRAAAIIIGIGGIGSDICARVEQMLPKDTLDNRYLRFVIMDTDRNTIRRLQRRGFGGTAIKLSDNMTVARCHEMLREKGLAGWYPQNGIYDNKAMTEGAGQYRSISRLAFEYALQESKLDELNRIIHDLNEIDIDDDDQPVRFYVICSLAGGTGSGIALPLALYISRRYMQEKRESLFNCKGFFVMSSAMHELGGTRLEQESIDTNAYAAIKELCAYMREVDERKAWDQIEPPLEKDPEITYLEEGKIYDYCYLFGMANGNGKTVHSFEDLKDMVAMAVYMQACSPMHDKNSSLEDNINRHLQRLMQQNHEKFLRRLGGIGCGELQYPYHKIREYLAMQWAQDMIGGLWQQYDKVYYQKVEEQERKRRLGRKAESVDQGAEYVGAIDKAANDPLAEEILSVCNPEKGPLWTQYLEAMFAKITHDIDAGFARERKKEGSLVQQCDRELGALENSHNRRRQRAEARNKLYKLLGKLDLVVGAGSRREADGYAKSWLVPRKIDGSCEPFQLEFWLMQQGQAIHPGAIRYFLYQLRTEILSVQTREEENIREIRGIIKKIDKDRDTDYSPLKGKRIYRQNYAKYKEVYTSIYEYAKHDIYRSVLSRTYEYVDGLAKAYERFFASYGELLDRFERDCAEIKDNLDRSRGIGISYICADKECRERLFEELKHSIYYTQAGKGISAYIYQLIQTRHSETKWEKKIYEQFKDYWIDNLESEFGDIINMDIIEAMVKQEYYKRSQALNFDSVKYYIEEAEEKMTAPLVQYLKKCGQQQEIAVYCYNTGMGEKNDLHKNVVKWLNDKGAVADENYCSKYQIMFYRSMVGLKASDIMEYFHRHCYDTPLQKGNAFRSYERDIRDIYRQDDDDTMSTPHIDKDWHSFWEMPDVEQGYQEETELQIGIIFYYSCIAEWDSVNKAMYSFSIDKERKVIKKDTLCDWHRYLDQNQRAVRILAEKFMEDVIKYKDGKPSYILDHLKDGGTFMVLLRYYSEIEIMEQNTIRRQPLLKAMLVILGLYAENQDDLKTMLEKYLTRNLLLKCKNELEKDMDDFRKKRMQSIYEETEKYLGQTDAAEIYQICTRLFCIEMRTARRKMGKNSI